MSEIASTVAKNLNFNEIAYSMLWEDHKVLEAALDIHEDDNILSLTSAGCNVLALLLKNPKSITAIDFNPTQNFLLEMKIAAIQHLDHGSFIKLLGFGEDNSENLKIFNQIGNHLSPVAQKWWKNNSDLIEDGIIHQGRLEKYFHGFHDGLSQFWSEEQFQSLLRCRSLGEQRLFGKAISMIKRSVSSEDTSICKSNKKAGKKLSLIMSR